jgi:hypothetical protein
VRKKDRVEMAERTRSPGGGGVCLPVGGARNYGVGIMLALLVTACGEDEPKDDEGAGRDADFSESGLGFSHLRGYYDEPFELEITHLDAAQIAYTLHCSDPRESSSAVVADLPLTLSVDPDSTTGRFTSPVAARAQRLLGGSGPLTESPGQARFRARVEKIDVAIIAESARWGDAQRGSPFTQDDHWTPEIETVLEEWFPARTDLVIEQLREVGLYSQ